MKKNTYILQIREGLSQRNFDYDKKLTEFITYKQNFCIIKTFTNKI